MVNKNLITKLAPIIIALLLVLAVFAIRAETINLGGISDPDMKALYQDENGMPYFTEIDSYYNYRLTENYLSTGHLGDTQVNGTDWDSLSTSPNGREANYQPVIIMLAAWVYNFVNIFGNVSLTQVAFWLGPFIGSLAVLPAFFIVKRATGSTWGAIVAGVIAGAAPAYFSHTYGGFFDTDMFNVLFPLMTVLFLTESIYARKPLFKAIYAALSAGFLALFSLSWSGYAYMVLLTFGSLILYFPVSYFMDKHDGLDVSNKKEWLKNNPATLTFIVFAILAIILLILTVGSTVVDTTIGILGMSTSLQSATAGSAYPNVYVSVGEMQIPDVIDILNNSGGIFTVLFALFGFVLMAYALRKKAKVEKPVVEEVEKQPKKLRTRRYIPKTKKAEEIAHAHENRFIPGKFEWTQDEKYHNLFLFVLLLLWTVGIAIMLTQGTRFIEQFEVPIALMAGISIGIFLKYIDLKIEQKPYVTFIAIILVLLAVVGPVYADHLTSSQAVGSTNDDMYNTLTWIKANTPENSVLASWWDFGHLFTAVADRQVVFDGGSQNNMRAYWIGNSLSTSNENLSAGILRMLANSGEDASNVLDLYTGDTTKTVKILNEILPMDRTQANAALTGTYALDQQQANSVLDLTHPSETKPVYLILSSDMLSKAAWWSYFGSWDFENQTSYHYSYYASQSQTEDISGKQFTLGVENGVVGVSGTSNETNGSTMNFAYIDQSKLNKTIDMFTTEDKERVAKELSEGTGNELLKPHKLIIVDNNQLSERIVNNNTNMSIIAFHQNDGSYFTVLFDSYLENAVFTKLYLESGYDTSRFTFAHSEPGISVWGVNEYPNAQSSGTTSVSNDTSN